MLFANTELRDLQVFVRHGIHKLSYTYDPAQLDIQKYGIQSFLFCEGVVETVEAVLKTLEAFIGGTGTNPDIPIVGSHVPEYMEKTNVDFLQEAMGLSLEKRTILDVDINPDLINSGDFFLIMRLDGLDPIIMWGTGSHGAHCVTALRFDGELYIVESQDAWYWPTHNIQRTPWKTWIQQARNASYNVVWMPLDAEAQLKYDEKKAQTFFEEIEGLPYGYHNLLFGWIDTVRDNLPNLLADQFAPILFSIIELVKPKWSNLVMASALNKRLGVENKNMSELANLAA